MRQLSGILSEMQAPTRDADYLLHAAECSPFFTRLAIKDKDFLTDLLDNLYIRYKSEDVFYWLSDKKILSENELYHSLRALRQKILAHLIVRDLNGLADFSEVVETTSALAEVCIQTAVTFYETSLKATFGTPRSTAGEAQQLIVVGMGKLGGNELNVSSDIDLIFAYEQAGHTDGAQSISNQDFFTRLGKKVIAALDEVTADGFVFRVDMRLRPYGSEGALVSELEALEDYYQHYGREWERYAWIKGRVVHGPSAALERVMKPFVFRKYLDFNAYAAMRDLKTQIQRDVVQRKLTDNIKLGRGGIREIEFIAQLFQLIRGGRIAELQIKPTLQVLDCLADRQILPQEDVQILKTSYIYLRNLEHRLMYIDDQQTQDLPKSDESRQHLLKMLHLESWEDFIAQLNAHRNRVQALFDAVFKSDDLDNLAQEQAIWQGIVSTQEATQTLAEWGFVRAADMANLLNSMRNSQKIQQLPELSKQRLDRLMPLLIRAAIAQAKPHAPDQALIRSLDLLEKICRRASYLALLVEFPDALTLVVRLCAASPWLAQYLTAHPILLDELLNEQTLLTRLDFTQLKAELSATVTVLHGDVEAQMDAMRHFKQVNVLKIAAQDLMTDLPLEAISDDLSMLAEVVLQVSVNTVWQNLPQRHLEEPRFAVIGYGKLGGRELGYLSDLDIIFLYDDADERAPEVYAKFAQRLNHWFNTLTNAGLLYETDLQLRPDGNSGLLVSSIQAFQDYQLHKAWVWEHQALTRARFVAGNPQIGELFEQIRLDILRAPKDLTKLSHQISEMRGKILASHRPQAGRFDVKFDRGGIIDVEFIVQYWVLGFSVRYPTLADNAGNIALLGRLADLGLMDAAGASQMQAAYRQYRRWIHAAKLQGENAVVETAVAVTHVHAVLAQWQATFADR